MLQRGTTPCIVDKKDLLLGRCPHSVNNAPWYEAPMQTSCSTHHVQQGTQKNFHFCSTCMYDTVTVPVNPHRAFSLKNPVLFHWIIGPRVGGPENILFFRRFSGHRWQTKGRDRVLPIITLYVYSPQTSNICLVTVWRAIISYFLYVFRYPGSMKCMNLWYYKIISSPLFLNHVFQ